MRQFLRVDKEIRAPDRGEKKEGESEREKEQINDIQLVSSLGKGHTSFQPTFVLCEVLKFKSKLYK